MLVDEPYRYRITDFDRTVFDLFVPREHPLAVALREIDWEDLRQTVEAHYSRDEGQPAIDPVRMLKLEFLRYRHSLSDRQVILRTTTDIAFRFFLQVGHAFRPPHFSSLSYFRGRLGEQGFAQVFDALVAQARRAGLVKDRLRLKDASHVVASIAVPATLTLVAQIRDRLLTAIEPFDHLWVAGQRIEAGLLRERTKDQRDESRLSARVTHLQELVAWSEQLPVPEDLDTNPATASAWKRFQDTLALAQKILADREPGVEHKTLSVHDPDARRGKHGGYYDGYLTDLLMDPDSGIITQINVLEAGGDEARDAVALVRAEQAAHGNRIEALSIDGAGFNGEMLRELEGPAPAEAGDAVELVRAEQATHGNQIEALSINGAGFNGEMPCELEGPAPAEAGKQGDQGLGVRVYVPPKAEPAGGRFTSADFTLNEEETAVTCPAGETSQYRQRDTGRHATIFRFTREKCDACLLVRQCVAKPGTGVFGRSVTKNDYREEYHRARERAKTDEFKAVRREHPAVERKLNEILNHHGGRRARYWGLAKVHIQELMTGFVVNTKRMVSLLAALRAEPTEHMPVRA